MVVPYTSKTSILYAFSAVKYRISVKDDISNIGYLGSKYLMVFLMISRMLLYVAYKHPEDTIEDEAVVRGAGAFEVAAQQHLVNEMKKTIQGRLVNDLVDATNVYVTLSKVIDCDVKTDTVQAAESLTCKLRRVRQGLDLIRELFQNYLST